jgi:hypothetical protein
MSVTDVIGASTRVRSAAIWRIRHSIPARYSVMDIGAGKVAGLRLISKTACGVLGG